MSYCFAPPFERRCNSCSPSQAYNYKGTKGSTEGSPHNPDWTQDSDCITCSSITWLDPVLCPWKCSAPAEYGPSFILPSFSSQHLITNLLVKLEQSFWLLTASGIINRRKGKLFKNNRRLESHLKSSRAITWHERGQRLAEASVSPGSQLADCYQFW